MKRVLNNIKFNIGGWNTVKYNSKKELTVLFAIDELGEASVSEIKEYIENHWKQLTNTEPTLFIQDEIWRYVRRWNKRKAISGNIVKGNIIYSLASIPWYPKNQIIRCLKTPGDTEAKAFMDVYEQKLSNRKSIRLPTPTHWIRHLRSPNQPYPLPRLP